MKALKIVGKILLVLTVLLFAVALLLPATQLAKAETGTVNPSFASIVVLAIIIPSIYYIILGLIIPFYFSNNYILKKLSYAALTAAIIINLVSFSNVIDAEVKNGIKTIGIGSILGIVGSILGIIVLVLFLVLNYVEISYDYENKIISDLEKWNNLKEKNIISEEEFQMKKKEILKKYSK